MTARFHLGFLVAWVVLALSRGSLLGAADSFDAAPYALPLPGGQGLMWEDPREIHKVVIHFRGAVPEPGQVHLEYWGSRWPQQHLPKDREPGGADVGWMELGNWHKGDWRTADTEVAAGKNTLTFNFRPVNAKEFPDLKDYSARFRYTLKLRVTGGAPLGIERMEAFTDSSWAERVVRVAWQTKPKTAAGYEVFNGVVSGTRRISDQVTELRLKAAANDDPNTFDRTLVTVRNGKEVFTFKVDDLAQGALWAPDFGVAVTAGEDARDYGAVAAEVSGRGAKTLYDRVAGMPEQTWRAAWAGIPRKKSDIYLPLGLDGGRQRFRLDPDGSISLRHKDALLRQRPGADTAGLDLEPPNVKFSFGLPPKPAFRTLDEESLPICSTTWRTNGLTVTQTAFVTELGGSQAAGPVPPSDTTAVLLARLVFTNESTTRREAQLPIRYAVENVGQPLRVDDKGELWRGENLRGQVSANRPATIEDLKWNWGLDPGEAVTAVVKIP
ncbi:MAG TPA: hypothetical protein VN794_13875, partial [Methylomirabilota bacterium]|nr:hypothetical protein [Methylomirabilota bacterium]